MLHDQEIVAGRHPLKQGLKLHYYTPIPIFVNQKSQGGIH